MIKDVPVQDLDQAVELGVKFWEEANLPGSLRPEIFKKNWEFFIDKGIGKIIGSYDKDELTGALGMIISPDINDGEKVATEAFWFVDQNKRGSGVKLLLNFLNSAKEYGCVRIIMVHLFTSNSEKISNLYSKLGFSKVEAHYIKSI